MAMRVASELKELFGQQSDGNLRSVIKYEEQSSDIVYIRDDVAEQYDERELEAAIADSRMESLTAPMYNESFSDDHGDLSCIVQCFENVIEMNFVIADGEGVAVALNADAMAETHGLVAEAREIVLAGRK